MNRAGAQVISAHCAILLPLNEAKWWRMGASANGDAEERAAWHLCALDFTVRGGILGESRWDGGCLYEYSIITPFVYHFAFMVNTAFLEGRVSSFIATFSSHPLPTLQIKCLGLPGEDVRIVMGALSLTSLTRLQVRIAIANMASLRSRERYLHFFIIRKRVNPLNLKNHPWLHFVVVLFCSFLLFIIFNFPLELTDVIIFLSGVLPSDQAHVT